MATGPDSGPVELRSIEDDLPKRPFRQIRSILLTITGLSTIHYGLGLVFHERTRNGARNMARIARDGVTHTAKTVRQGAASAYNTVREWLPADQREA
ncbi:MAG: hypothetical protein ACE5DX_02325 [Candidatus Dojkabacteria bacterium]